MAWYWIVLIVAAALFGLLFLAYMTNTTTAKPWKKKSDMSQRRCLKTAERLLRGSAFNDIRSTRKG